MRPRLERPTVRQLDTSTAALGYPDGTRVPLTSDAFSAFLARREVFAVEYPLGTFLVMADKHGRGDRYWTARAYWHGRRAVAYLGRLVTVPGLRAASATLAERVQSPAPPAAVTPAPAGPPAPSLHEVLAAFIAQAPTDPARQAAVTALADLLERTFPVTEGHRPA